MILIVFMYIKEKKSEKKKLRQKMGKKNKIKIRKQNCSI